MAYMPRCLGAFSYSFFCFMQQGLKNDYDVETEKTKVEV